MDVTPLTSETDRRRILSGACALSRFVKRLLAVSLESSLQSRQELKTNSYSDVTVHARCRDLSDPSELRVTAVPLSTAQGRIAMGCVVKRRDLDRRVIWYGYLVLLCTDSST